MVGDKHFGSVSKVSSGPCQICGTELGRSFLQQRQTHTVRLAPLLCSGPTNLRPPLAR